jgi:hypothetical protein
VTNDASTTRVERYAEARDDLDRARGNRNNQRRQRDRECGIERDVIVGTHDHFGLGVHRRVLYVKHHALAVDQLRREPVQQSRRCDAGRGRVAAIGREQYRCARRATHDDANVHHERDAGACCENVRTQCPVVHVLPCHEHVIANDVANLVTVDARVGSRRRTGGDLAQRDVPGVSEAR